MHNVCVPQVFQDGARRLDVGQAAVLLGWTKDPVRAACERGELAHQRDHLNAYRIPCSAGLGSRNALGHKTLRLRGLEPPRFKIDWSQDAVVRIAGSA